MHLHNDAENSPVFQALPTPSEGIGFEQLTFQGTEASSWEVCNHLSDVSQFNNRYIALRHGKSEANERGIHSGDQEIGARRYPLTATGIAQVEQSVRRGIIDGVLHGDMVVIASYFLRVRETAEIAAQRLGIREIYTDARLGERGAGELEGRSVSAEEKAGIGRIIRPQDQEDPFHTKMDIESPASVLYRATGLVRELEQQYSGKDFLLVGHHDTIKILQTGFMKIAPGEYHRLPKLANAGLVKLIHAE